MAILKVEKIFKNFSGIQFLRDVKETHTYYGKSHILHGFSMDVDKGEIIFHGTCEELRENKEVRKKYLEI